jgi:hypothetical protein
VFLRFMLNLPVAMNYLLALLLWMGIGLWGPLSMLDQQQVTIDSPKAGQALQGQVAIRGTTQVDGFQSYEISFSYQHDTTNTWFPVALGKDAVKEGELATWDTTTISDGLYKLKVVVYLRDGRAVQTVVGNLRVRNYTPIETSTPAPAVTVDLSTAQFATAQDYVPGGLVTPSPLAENPARVTDLDLGVSLVRGGMVALVLFIVIGLYLGLRTLFRRR